MSSSAEELAAAALGAASCGAVVPSLMAAQSAAAAAPDALSLMVGSLAMLVGYHGLRCASSHQVRLSAVLSRSVS